MAKILAIEGENIKPLDRAKFNFESDLQDYLEKYPTIIPLDEIIEDASELICIGRGVTVPSGAIDLMYIDKAGLITIVDTKLVKNPESRRAVIGQFTEYASFISQWKIEDVYEVAYNYVAGKSNEEMASLFLGQFSKDNLKHYIEDNLQNGRIRLIIAVDELDEPLRATVTFLNSHSNFDILLLQVSSFEESKAKKVIIPKLFGYTTKSGKPRPPKPQWNLEKFLADAEKRCSKEKVDVLRKLIDFTTEHSEGGILWGQGRTYGTFAFRKEIGGIATSVYYVYSDGTTLINFGTLKNKGTSPAILESFRANLNIIPRVKIGQDVVTNDNKTGSLGLTSLANHENFELFKNAVLALCQQIQSSKEHNLDQTI